MFASNGKQYWPAVVIYVGGVRNTRYITALDVIMSDSTHSLAQISIVYTAPKPVKGRKVTPFVLSHQGLWKENTPVRIQYGRTPSPMAEFYGYVLSNQVVHRTTDKRSGALLNVEVKYLIMGPSMRMQIQRNVPWRNVTASYIARKIAVNNQMKAVVDQIAQVMPVRSQAGKSDFKFLSELAAQFGFRFFIDNTTLYFINPLRVLQSAANPIPQFTMDRIPGQWEGLMSFERISGSTVPDGGTVAKRVINGLNPNTRALINATHEYLRYTAFGDTEGIKPLVTIYKQDRVVESLAEAKALIAADAANNRLWIAAKAQTEGNPNVKPGTLVELSGRALSTDDQGLWLVKSVTHSVRMSLNAYNSTFYTKMSLGRDQIYDVRYHASSAYEAALAAARTQSANAEWRADHYGTSNVR